jgi:hypothetical protein
LVSEGKLGGRREGAGRPRKGASKTQKKRASQVITEWAQENGDKLADVIGDVLRDPDATRTEKMRAARLGLKVEAMEEEHCHEDERQGRTRELPIPEDRDEIIGRLAKTLQNPLVRERFAALFAALPPASND